MNRDRTLRTRQKLVEGLPVTAELLRSRGGALDAFQLVTTTPARKVAFVGAVAVIGVLVAGGGRG